MYYIKDTCYICLKHEQNLQRLLKDSCGNTNYYSKLTSSVPEMVYSALEENGMICLECCTKLDDVYRFREQCLRSKHFLTDYILKLHLINNTTGVLNVCLKDFKHEIKTSIRSFEQFENFYHKGDDLIIKTHNRYIVASRSLNNDSNNIDSLTRTEIQENESLTACSDAGTTGYEEHTDDTFHNDDVKNVVIKEETDITIEYQDIADCELKADVSCTIEQETRSSGNNVSSTDNMSENYSNSNVIIKEEFDIKFEEEDLSEFEECKEENDLESAAHENVTDTSLDDTYGTSKLLREHTHFKSQAVRKTCAMFQKSSSCNSKLIDNKHIVCKQVQSNDPFKCEACNRRFRQKADLVRHKRTHTGEKLFKCTTCNKTFSNTSNLIKHIRVHTNERPFTCTFCKKVFSQSSHLTNHKLIHTGEKSYKCDICNKMFSQKSYLIRHKRTHTGEKPYKCQTCNKTFSDTGNLVRHKRVHTMEKPFKCTFCKRTFSQSAHLNRHSQIHFNKKLGKCDICNKTFSKKSHLCKHKRLYTDEKLLICKICNKKFSIKSNLDKHISTHTAKQAFKCETCNKTLSNKSNFKKHLRMHAGVKLFKCTFCKSAFAQKSHLVIHNRIHTGEKPFKCDKCDKAFSHKWNLVVHIRTHKKDKPF